MIGVLRVEKMGVVISLSLCIVWVVKVFVVCYVFLYLLAQNCGMFLVFIGSEWRCTMFGLQFNIEFVKRMQCIIMVIIRISFDFISCHNFYISHPFQRSDTQQPHSGSQHFPR